MTEREQTTTEEGIWINPFTGRELGATLQDIIDDAKKDQEKGK
ncbi:hypothetical protein N9955_00680 [bacterium]|nr:hypothetical protein [bacterium]